MPYKEADIYLALSAINSSQIQSIKRAIATFSVPKTTLRDRRARKPTRRDCQPNIKNLTKLEEEVIIGYILNLDLRGFTPTLDTIGDIANKLLTKRGVGYVS